MDSMSVQTFYISVHLSFFFLFFHLFFILLPVDHGFSHSDGLISLLLLTFANSFSEVFCLMQFVVDFPFLFLLPFKSLLSSSLNISLKDLILQILLHFFDPVVFYMNFSPILRLRYNFQSPCIFLLLQFKKFLSFFINLVH